MDERQKQLLRLGRLLWMGAAWGGIGVGALALCLVLARVAGAEMPLPAVIEQDLLGAAGFFALIVGLCVWLLRYGRRFFDRLQK